MMMRTREKSRSSLLISVRRILVLLLCICGIVMNRSAGTQNAAAQASSPVQCDSGMSRHSLHAAALKSVAYPLASANSGSSLNAPAGMVWIPGGRFWMGTDHMDDAKPVHEVEVKGFWMDSTDVTNEQFERFVKATGYLTIAERPLNQREFPNLAPDELAAGSVVFTPAANPISLNDPLAWWRFVRGANWRHPEGPNSDLRGKEKYPVVHIAWPDAMAYAKW